MDEQVELVLEINEIVHSIADISGTMKDIGIQDLVIEWKELAATLSIYAQRFNDQHPEENISKTWKIFNDNICNGDVEFADTCQRFVTKTDQTSAYALLSLP